MNQLEKEHNDFYSETKLYYLDSQLYYVGCGYATNAVESIIMKSAKNKHKYVGELELRLLADDEKIRLEVEDNGTGIDYKVEPYLFLEPVNSAKEKMDNVYGGKGFFLYQAKKYVEELKGEVGYKNKGLNNGAIFWYEVPIKSIIKQK